MQQQIVIIIVVIIIASIDFTIVSLLTSGHSAIRVQVVSRLHRNRNVLPMNNWLIHSTMAIIGRISIFVITAYRTLIDDNRPFHFKAGPILNCTLKRIMDT
jgi:hypothetical protein